MWPLHGPSHTRTVLVTALLCALLATTNVRFAVGDAPRDAVGGVDNNPHRIPARHRHAAAPQVDDALVDERLNKYIPTSHEGGTLAQELRAAREGERRREEHDDEARVALRSSSSSSTSKKSAAPAAKKTPSSPARRAASGIKQGVSAVRRASRKASSRVHHMLDPDYEDEEEEEYDEEGDEGDDDDEQTTAYRRSSTRARRRSAARRRSTKSTSTFSNIGRIISRCFWLSVGAARWSGRNVVWTPMTYISAAVQWTAHTSWRTTRWTGERAVFGPARTVTAPLIYLVDGLLFIFVWVPASVIRVVVRELYPVYVFLGAALAIGTAMGIAAAIALYIGSFVFGDQSQVEGEIYKRGERLPRDLSKQLQDSFGTDFGEPRGKKGRDEYGKHRSSSGRKRSGSGGVIEQAIRESLARERSRSGSTARSSRKSWASGMDSAPDSDEEDDYFGASAPRATASYRRSSGSTSPTDTRISPPSKNITPGSAPAAAAAYTRPLPAGATSHNVRGSSRSGSSSSTPVGSPDFARPPSHSASPFAYASRSRTTAASPAAGPPDAIRTHHSRQRRNIQVPVST